MNHPKHYAEGDAKCAGCGRTIECIDVVQHMSFPVGNTVKYCWRAGKKDIAPALQDLEKARWYLDHEIKRLKDEALEARPSDPPPPPKKPKPRDG